MSNKKESYIAVRVTEDMYVKISNLAAKMEDGNISKFMRKLLKTVIKNS